MKAAPPVLPKPTPPEFRVIQLSAEDAAIWRDAIEAQDDAQRHAEIALQKARLALAEAQEATIGMLRGMAEKYGFDRHGRYTLSANGQLAPATEGGR